MRVAVLGPVEVVDGGTPVDVGTPKQRAILAALVLHRPHVVAVDSLVDLVWGDDPPPSPLSSLHGYISGLRRVLEPRRVARQRASVLLTVPPGYAIRIPDEHVDASRFAAVVDAVHRRLAGTDGQGVPAVPADVDAAGLADIACDLRGALDLWRGSAYQDLEDAGAAVAERARLAELRLVAVEDLALVRLELGEQATVAAELSAVARQHPLRERLWALRVLALARAGRQADAFEALHTIRRTLAEEMGVDPGSALRAVELAVLRQDAPAARAARADPSAPVAPAHPAAPAAAVARVAEPAAVDGDRAAAVDGDRWTPELPGPVAVPGDPRTWPLIGRDAELAALTALLDRARQGRTGLALLVGEPGIGKSRLVAELAGHAGDGGFAVLMGRCSEDDGAPPFWPWAGVLRDLAEALGADLFRDLVGADADRLAGLLPPSVAVAAPGPGDVRGHPVEGLSAEAERFRVSDAVARLLAAAAAHRPLLVVLDDLHWADPSSLRLLRHVGDHLVDARVLIVTTRRAHPEPAGVLADVGAGLSRRHALRLDLSGLSAGDVAELVRAVTGRTPAQQQAGSLRERTDGNPFFLVELLRLPAAAEIPAAVSEVVAGRVERLPEATRKLLRTAAVIGRHYDVDLLAAAAGCDPDTALDDLDPALAAGVVLEESEPGRFRFGHALVRDVVYRAQQPTRRARRHAAVASALTDLAHGGDEWLSETARHWLAAGPARAGVAWRAAARAADRARSLHGYEEAAALLAAARAAQAQDRTCGPGDRYDLLMAHAEACRWIGDRDGQLDALDQACRAADELGDVGRLARAAVGSADGSVWTIRDQVVHAPAVTALRRVLRDLPAGDSDLRCRALLTLSGELHYADAPRERDALAEEGLAMSRRIGDPGLLAWAATTAFVATWQAANAEQRWLLIDQVIGAADEHPTDRATRAHLLTFRAIAGLETGRVEAMWRDITEARAGAERLRLPFLLLVLNSIELPWRAMQGRFAETDSLLAEVADLGSRTSLPAKQYIALAPIFVRIWQERAGEFLPMVRDMYAAAGDLAIGVYLLVLARAGERDEAAAVLRRGRWVPDGGSWAATFDLSILAHVAYLVRDPQLAAEVYRQLAPYAGRPATAGSGAALGPVDGYLALAAATTGERDLAGRHADAAAALATAWDLPLVSDWIAGLRADGGF